MFSTELFVQTLIAGIMIGVLYALMALGITFIYSIVKMINWSMGEFYMIGGYVQFLLITEWLGPDLWWVAAPLSALGVFLLGYLLEPLLIKPMFTSAIERKDDYAIVVTTPLVGNTMNTGASRAPASPARPTPMPKAIWSRRNTSTPAVCAPMRLCAAARSARPSQVFLSSR